jgi:hypothetical protein
LRAAATGVSLGNDRRMKAGVPEAGAVPRQPCHPMSLDALIGRQNPDGGWPYSRGGSWTEPTVYAIMALLSAGETASAQRGVAWLGSIARRDGGWPPRAGVDMSTWVTGLVALLGPRIVGAAPYGRAIHWLLDTTGEESTFAYRLREWLLGNNTSENDAKFPGWPWVPSNAGWVVPTSIAILALDKEERRQPSTGVHHRIDAGRHFLLGRACDEGGWNYGSSHPLGYPSLAYPETTGLALAALRGVRSPQVGRALVAAQRFFAECRSADALNWLRFGLRVHGKLPAGYCTPSGVEFRTIPETSLDLVMTAAEQGRDFFWG